MLLADILGAFSLEDYEYVRLLSFWRLMDSLRRLLFLTLGFSFLFQCSIPTVF